jgi:hypothetical protein
VVVVVVVVVAVVVVVVLVAVAVAVAVGMCCYTKEATFFWLVVGWYILLLCGPV